MTKPNHPKQEQISVIQNQTLHELFKIKGGADAVSLYFFYYYHAGRQETNQPRATPKFCQKGLGWGKIRFFNGDKILREANLIEKIPIKNERGWIINWYVKLKYKWKHATINEMQKRPLTRPEGIKTRRLEKPPGGLQPTNALSNISRNALSKINKDIAFSSEKASNSNFDEKKAKRQPSPITQSIEFIKQINPDRKITHKDCGVLKQILTKQFAGNGEEFLNFIKLRFGTGRPPEEFTWLHNEAWIYVREKQANEMDENLARKEDERYFQDRNGGLYNLKGTLAELKLNEKYG